MHKARKARRTLSLALAAALVLTVAGCSEKTSPSSAGQDVPSQSAPDPDQDRQVTGHIVVYTSEPQDLVTDMLEDFRAKYPGITYDLFRSGSGAVISKLDAEMEAGGTEADVVWIADIGYLTRLDEEGLIHHYTPAAAAGLDPRFNYNDGMAWEVRQIFNVIACNTLKNTADITDWADLADPSLNGRFAMANPSYSGGAFTTLVGLTQTQGLGWELFEAYKQNNMKFEQSNGNLQTKVSSGEYAAVSIVDFMARSAQAEGSPVQTVWPASGAVMVPTPVAILEREGDDRAACQALMDYLLTEDAQRFFVAQGYIPVDPAAGVPQGAPDLQDIRVVDLDLNTFVTQSAEIRERFESIFGPQ